MVTFLVGASIGVWIGALATILILFHEPEKKELSKEDWKAGYRQK